MEERTILAIRIDSNIKERLEDLAKLTKRSKSSLAAEAIEVFVDLEERRIQGIKQAMDPLDRREGMPHEEVAGWIASW